jgi:DNA-binding response OmpR family regulator
MAQHILIVDDDALLRRSLSIAIAEAGYRASTAANADDALSLVERDQPNLILLDVGLPGMDGLEALRQLRRARDIPVIFVTARRRDLDTILGLELGADSYITKPFDPDVLLAHIKAVLRRSRPEPAMGRLGRVEAGDLTIDLATHTATIDGKPLDLSAREFALLYTLASEAGQVLSIDDLIERVWGAEYVGESQSVYVYIRLLREKVEADPQRPQRIVNVRGVGYKLVPRTG